MSVAEALENTASFALRKLHDGGVYKISPLRHFTDGRGEFIELHRVSELAGILRGLRFAQSNLSRSMPYTVRGLHYQLGPCGKLVRCVQGAVFQACVDVRKGSLTFGTWVGTPLNAITHEAVYIPPGFANGFISLDQGAIVHYEMTDYFDAAKERQLKWDDPEVGIAWPIGRNISLNISAKDKAAPRLADAEPWRPAMVEFEPQERL